MKIQYGAHEENESWHPKTETSDIKYVCHVVVEEKWQNVIYFELSHQINQQE